MVPKYSSVVILLAIIGLNSGLSDSYANCPRDSEARKLVATLEKEISGNISDSITLTVHIPASGGLLPDPITCIMVTDLSTDGEGGVVSVPGGGIGSKFVELKIVSYIGKGLNYRFEVWTS